MAPLLRYDIGGVLVCGEVYAAHRAAIEWLAREKDAEITRLEQENRELTGTVADMEAVAEESRQVWLAEIARLKSEQDSLANEVFDKRAREHWRAVYAGQMESQMRTWDQQRLKLFDEIARLRKLNESLAERVAAQSELLTRRAAYTHAEHPVILQEGECHPDLDQHVMASSVCKCGRVKLTECGENRFYIDRAETTP